MVAALAPPPPHRSLRRSVPRGPLRRARTRVARLSPDRRVDGIRGGRYDGRSRAAQSDSFPRSRRLAVLSRLLSSPSSSALLRQIL